MNPHLDFLMMCAANGSLADFGEASDAEFNADWIRSLLLGLAVVDDGHHQPGNALVPRAVRIRGATIFGKLDLQWCGSLSQPLPPLIFQKCKFIASDTNDFSAVASDIDLSNAWLAGFELVDCALTHLRGVGVHIEGSMDISRMHALYDGAPCWCKLSRVQVEGHFVAHDITLQASQAPAKETSSGSVIDFAEETWALNLFMSRIAGSITVRNAAVSGGILLDAAQIGGNFVIADSVIIGKHKIALSLSGASIGANVLLATCTCEGTLWMSRTAIDGSFDLTDQKILCGPFEKEIAVYAAGSCVGGWLTWTRVTADGLLCLHDLEVKGRLTFEELVIAGADRLPDWLDVLRQEKRTPSSRIENFALDLHGVRGHSKFRFKNNKFAGGWVDLSDASCTTLDDTSAGYGGAAGIMIDGFKYERLECFALDGNSDDRSRLYRWLPADVENYVPHPYVQLAQVLVRNGDDSHARDVLQQKARLELQRHWVMRSGNAGATLSGKLSSKFSQLIHLLFLRPYGVAFKFGLSPARAIVTLAIAIALGALAFWSINERGGMVIAQTAVATYTTGNAPFVNAPKLVFAFGTDRMSANIRCADNINEILYAADVFIPLIDLREESKCEIGAASDVRALPAWELRIYQFIKALYAVLGWIVTTMALLTFSGVIRHQLMQD